MNRGAYNPKHDLVRGILVVAVYVATAKLGIELSVAHGVITPVWAPTGISLAALLLYGYRLWPAVAIGALIANATSDVSVATATGIALGNTLEAVAGAFLLRSVGFKNSLARTQDVFAFVILGAVVSTMVSATVGTTTLWLDDVVVGSEYFTEWRLWWFGDLIGNLIVAPVLLVWLTRASDRRRVTNPFEGLALTALVAVTSWIVFFGGRWQYPYVLFPLLVWATLRFKQRGGTVATLVVASVAVWGTVHGSVPIGAATPTESVQILQALIGIVAVSLLFLGAVLAERETAEHALKEAHESLAEAQRIAHLGSWEWDLATNRVTWSEEMHRIFGVKTEDFGANYEAFLERVHPEDRGQVMEQVDDSLKTFRPFLFDHRIVRTDGAERTMRARGYVVADAQGHAVKMTGTAQDITEHKQLEEDERRLHEARLRQQQALELNDEVVQGLAEAKLALEIGEKEATRATLEATLNAARAIVADLLQTAGEDRELEPGDFVRSKPAAVRAPRPG